MQIFQHKGLSCRQWNIHISCFKYDCTSKHQKLTFSGVEAHHQNRVAKQNIKTISKLAWASMLHAAHLLPEHANIKLWPQAVDYAV
jgi:hypothetical protein